jgi:hypothetical protein
MEGGYPKLIGVAAADRGCRLLLSDQSQVSVDVTTDQIDAHLSRRGLPTLAEFCRRRDVAVLGDSIQVGASEWDRLMLRLREDKGVQRLAHERPDLAEALRVSHTQAGNLPLRIFECLDRGCIYLFYPYSFLPEQDAPGWYRVAFRLPGEWALQGRLNMGSWRVEVEMFHSPGWCIAEPVAAPDPDK